MNVSVSRQCIGRGETEAAGYKSVGPIRKYQGEWQPPAGYHPYVPKNKSEYGHHLFVMPKNEVHGRVGQINPGSPGVGQHMAEHEKSGKVSGTLTIPLYRGGIHRGAPYDFRHDAEL